MKQTKDTIKDRIAHCSVYGKQSAEFRRNHGIYILGIG